MKNLLLLPVIISILLIAAHFYRADLEIVASVSLAMIGMLFIKQLWSVRLIQIFLLISAGEWLRTLIHLIEIRIEQNMDWMRLAVILGTVALFTALSALVFHQPVLRNKYRLRRADCQ